MALISPSRPAPPSVDSSPWQLEQEFFFIFYACLPTTSVPSPCPRFFSSLSLQASNQEVVLGGVRKCCSPTEATVTPALPGPARKEGLRGKCAICLVGKWGAVINDSLTREHADVFTNAHAHVHISFRASVCRHVVLKMCNLLGKVMCVSH